MVVEETDCVCMCVCVCVCVCVRERERERGILMAAMQLVKESINYF